MRGTKGQALLNYWPASITVNTYGGADIAPSISHRDKAVLSRGWNEPQLSGI